MVDFRVSYIIQILKSTNKYFFSLENLNVHLLIDQNRSILNGIIFPTSRVRGPPLGHTLAIICLKLGFRLKGDGSASICKYEDLSLIDHAGKEHLRENTQHSIESMNCAI